MPLINYIDAKGNQFEADVAVGSTVMQGAVDNMIDGILAECGGACAIAMLMPPGKKSLAPPKAMKLIC